jgi:hypothetical protein
MEKSRKMEFVENQMERRIKMNQDTIDDFATKVARNPTYHLVWNAEDVMKAEMLRNKRLELLEYLRSDKFTLEVGIDELSKERQRQTSYLLDIKPWNHNSTSAMANLENLCKANTMAVWIKELDEIIGYLKTEDWN